MAGACCYPKAARLRRRSEYLGVQQRGRRRHTTHFVFLSAVEPNGPGVRLGVTVSARVGGAVVRNRIKRQVREVFRALRRELAGPADFVAIAKPSAARASNTELRRELREGLSHA